MSFLDRAAAVQRLALGVATGVAFGWAAWRARFLTGAGAVAGGGLAASIVGLGGPAWAVPSFVFFLSSSLLSRLGRARKAAAERLQMKSSVRDSGQVMANGGVAWGFVLLHAVCPSRLWHAGFLGAFAAAAADTWATEVGTLSRRPPRHLLTGRPAQRGASGAVSLVGTLAAVGGALSVAVAAGGVLPGRRADRASLMVSVALAGVAGAFADSLLGATVQASYRNPRTGGRTERPADEGRPNDLVRGWEWVTNDTVNAACTATGAALAMLGTRAFGRRKRALHVRNEGERTEIDAPEAAGAALCFCSDFRAAAS